MKGCEMTEAKREGFSTSDAGHPQEYPEDSNITRAMNWLQEPIAPSSAVDEAIFEKWCELDDLERKIRELKLLKPQSITEVDTQSKMLADLESKRSALLRFFDGSPDAAIAQAGQQQPEQSPAPASAEQVEPAHVAPAEASRILKKRVLVQKLQYKWPTIEADLSEASRNGLSAAAHRGRGWCEMSAEKWADENGKLSGVEAKSQVLSGWQGTVHRIAG